MENNEKPVIIHVSYADGTSYEGPIDFKACSDKELIRFYLDAGIDQARLEYRERTGRDLSVTLSSPQDKIKEHISWLYEWWERNPDKDPRNKNR